MAAYTTLAVIKSSSYLDIQDTADDAGLEQCINAASSVTGYAQ